MRKNINTFNIGKDLQISLSVMLENTNAIFRDFQMLWIIKNKEIQ